MRTFLWDLDSELSLCGRVWLAPVGVWVVEIWSLHGQGWYVFVKDCLVCYWLWWGVLSDLNVGLGHCVVIYRTTNGELKSFFLASGLHNMVSYL